MRIGLQVPSFTWSGHEIGPKLGEIAQRAEAAGFYSFWVMDHFFQIRGVGEPEEPMLEGYTTLGYVTSLTQRMKLGTLVTGVVYRYPGILAKTVTTLDVLSGGRAYLGIGAAWFEREARGLGVPFPPLKDRFEQLEETLQIVHQMWGGEVKPYDGKHYQLAETLNSPQPISKPHPPIMIGGEGENKTLRLLAKYGDACNFFAWTDYETKLPHLIDVLKQRCEEVGRDYNKIEKTTLNMVHLAPGQMTAQDVIRKCKQMAEMGFQHAIFNMPNVQEMTPLEIFEKEIIPAVAEF